MAVLDTSFLIDLDRRHSGAVDVLRDLVEREANLLVPFIVGLQFAAGHKDSALAWARLRDDYTVVEFTPEMAEEATPLARALGRRGVFPGWSDFLIAATALHYGEPLATADGRAFPSVPGLRLVRYR